MNTETAIWFIACEGKVLLEKHAEERRFPQSARPPLPLDGEVINIGCINGTPCLAGATSSAPEGWDAPSLLEVNELFGREFYLKAGRAAQLAHWRKNSRFCPVCGGRTSRHKSFTAMICGGCGNMLFAQPTTALLVLVQKDDQILLTQSHSFRNNNYGLVAGYMEQGESFEECAAREVLEETGLSIKNMRYFGSEPWPFPNNVMVGFVADYDSGEIRIQEDELNDAGFFTRDAMPQLPGKITLTRRMIDWWLGSA